MCKHLWDFGTQYRAKTAGHTHQGTRYICVRCGVRKYKKLSGVRVAGYRKLDVKMYAEMCERLQARLNEERELRLQERAAHEELIAGYAAYLDRAAR
jgi:hypothetical protein